MKKDEHLENKKNVTLGPKKLFEFLNVRPFSPGHPLESNMCNQKTRGKLLHFHSLIQTHEKKLELEFLHYKIIS